MQVPPNLVAPCWRRIVGAALAVTLGLAAICSSGAMAATADSSSHIKGGPFNGFTGVWHLTGTYSSAQ